jgi:hypothetical protein
LLAQRGEDDQQNAAAVLGPTLGDHRAGLDGLAEADFIGKPAGSRRPSCTARRITPSRNFRS